MWATPVITPANATVNSPVTAFTVVNELNCEKVGTLIVEKKVENHTLKQLPSSTTYPISVSCSAPSNLSTSFNLPNGGTHTETNIPYGSTCTVSEGALPLPNVCPPQFTPVWTTTYSASNTATINAPSTTIDVLNSLTCKRTAAVCNPPMVLQADGTCGCPPGTHPTPDGKGCEGPHPPICPPPSTPGPVLGQCICPAGMTMVNGVCVTPPPPPPPPPPACRSPMVQVHGHCECPAGMRQRGNTCVRTITCRGSLVPNASGTACICTGGKVRRGNGCFEPVVCRSPAKPNRAGTACECPRDMQMVRGTCVDIRRRGVSPRDIFRGGRGEPSGRGQGGQGGQGGQSGGGRGRP